MYLHAARPANILICKSEALSVPTACRVAEKPKLKDFFVKIRRVKVGNTTRHLLERRQDNTRPRTAENFQGKAALREAIDLSKDSGRAESEASWLFYW